MSTNTKEYVNPLDSDVRLRAEFTKRKGRIIRFVVQVEVLMGEQWVPAVRFDTSHGFAHRDLYKPDGTVKRHEPMPATEFNAAFNHACYEATENWQRYVKGFRGTKQ